MYDKNAFCITSLRCVYWTKFRTSRFLNLALHHGWGHLNLKILGISLKIFFSWVSHRTHRKYSTTCLGQNKIIWKKNVAFYLNWKVTNCYYDLYIVCQTNHQLKYAKKLWNTTDKGIIKKVRAMITYILRGPLQPFI